MAADIEDAPHVGSRHLGTDVTQQGAPELLVPALQLLILPGRAEERVVHGRRPASGTSLRRAAAGLGFSGARIDAEVADEEGAALGKRQLQGLPILGATHPEVR